MKRLYFAVYALLAFVGLGLAYVIDAWDRWVGGDDGGAWA